MSEILLKETYPIKQGDFVRAGEASAHIKNTLKKLGINSELTRRAAIIAYECELNMIIHSFGGIMNLEVTPHFITITSEDTGPGIKDINLALQEGWSTAPDSVREMGFGAGMGLPNMKKHTDIFEIHSKYGEGTKINMKIKLH